jgi:branched-chain amino acid transport system ATP-binding protein
MQQLVPAADVVKPLLLEGRDLHTYYGQSHILRGVTFGIRPGETIGLMGRNGMGKSTLIRTMMGLVPPKRGTVRVDGQDVTGTEPYRMAQAGIAYVPEGRGIFSTLSVRENLEIAARAGTDGKTVWTPARVLELFPRLSERITNRGDQLSGGEQQMLAVGRALTTNPRLLILDEATEGLAPLIRDEIWKTIRLVRDSGIATIIVDKTVAAVTAISDRVVVLVKGEIVFNGQPGALTSDAALMQRHLGV